MKKNTKINSMIVFLSFGCLLSLWTAESANAQTTRCNDLKNRTWVNQLKSELVIQNCDDTKGTFDGTYKSFSGAGPQRFPMIGAFNQSPPSGSGNNATVIAFTVRWNNPLDPPQRNIGSITAWNGILRNVNGVPTIKSQWLLSRSNSDFEWDHVFVGQDTFIPNK